MRTYQADGRRMTRADRCPFGQQADPADPSRLIDNPEELAALERIRTLRSEGKGAKAITAALNAERFPCRGWCWHVTTVKRCSCASGWRTGGLTGPHLQNDAASASRPQADGSRKPPSFENGR